MKRIVGSLLAAGALVAASGSVARAQGHEQRPHLTRSAPEIDPIAGGAMIAVLVGGTLVIAARGAGRRRAARAQ
ncbi:MAG TPA: hypothetical protein VIF57_32355 [Polyangia bacterium]